MGKQFEITLNSALVFVQVNQAAKQEDSPVSFPFPPLNAALPPSSRPSLQPWVTCETVPSSLTNTLSLSGLKSLVIMLPGSTTRDCCGSSVLQNAWRKASSSAGVWKLEHETRLTVSDEGPSQSVLPASLLVHSCVLSLPMLSAVTPGTTRGMWASFVGSEYVLLWKYTAVLFWTASQFFAWANARCWDSSCFKLKRARGLQLDDDVAPARSARHVTRSPAF